jgi:O-succinylbenzoate synthase
MLESAIGESVHIEFASLPNIRLPSDIVPSSRFYKLDTTDPANEMTGGGTYELSCQPGIGHNPVWETIESYTVKHWSSD